MATQSKLVTYDDYVTLPDDGNRYEIIGGELLMTPSPTSLHQRISFKLSNSLGNYVGKNDLGYIFYAPMDVVLSFTDVVQPDLMFISKQRSEIISEKIL